MINNSGRKMDIELTGLSEDDQKRAEKQVEDATKNAIAKVDTAAESKAKEIEAI